jgi:hypothetical protein
MRVSPLAPLGAAIVAWASFAVREPHVGGATEATFCTKPCIHAGPDNPVVRYNAASGGAKSMEKRLFSTVFFGFYA